MVFAVGASPTFSIPSNASSTSIASAAGIEAQIARDQKELANCINCESAETKQGQADIQALTNRISVARARLEQITNANPADQTVAEGKASADSAVTLNTSDSGEGRFVNEYV